MMLLLEVTEGNSPIRSLSGCCSFHVLHMAEFGVAERLASGWRPHRLSTPRASPSAFTLTTDLLWFDKS